MQQTKFYMNEKFDYKQLAADILAKRIADNITIRTTAELAKVSHSTIHRAEAEGGKMDVDSILLICSWLGKPIVSYVKQANEGRNKKRSK